MIRQGHRRGAGMEKHTSMFSMPSPWTNALASPPFNPPMENMEMLSPYVEGKEESRSNRGEICREDRERLLHLHVLHTEGESRAGQWPDYPDAPVVDIYRDPSPQDPNIVVVWVLCPWCGRRHKHGGAGLRASSCGRSYYVAGVRQW